MREETAGTLRLCWTLHSSFAMWHVNLYWRSSTFSLVSRCCWHLVCCFNWQVPNSKCYIRNVYNTATHFIRKSHSKYFWIYFMIVHIYLLLFFSFFFFYFLSSFYTSPFVHTSARLQPMIFILASPQVHAAMFTWWLMRIPARLQMSRQKKKGNGSCFFFSLSSGLQTSLWQRVSSPQMLPLVLLDFLSILL